MSDIFPNPDRHSAGFTLLEILVVLVLLSLVGGLVVPRLGTIYQSLLVRQQRDKLLLQIEALPYLAYQHGRSFRLADPDRPEAETLEGMEGWRMESSEPILVYASGVCSGGSVKLQHENGQSWSYELASPYCRPMEKTDEVD